MAALVFPLAHIADALPGQPVFFADGEALGVVDQIVRVGDESASRDCLVVVPEDAHPDDSADALVIPADAVSAVTEDLEVVLRTTRPWVGHYCLTPGYGRCGADPSHDGQGRPPTGSVWGAVRARVRRPGRR